MSKIPQLKIVDLRPVSASERLKENSTACVKQVKDLLEELDDIRDTTRKRKTRRIDPR